MRYLTSAIFGAALLAAGSVAADEAEIEAAIARWQDAFNAGDGMAAAETVFTEDARLLPPDGPMVEGRDNIAAFWQAQMDGAPSDLELGLIAVDIQGDTAIETGTWAVMVPSDSGGEPTRVGGKTLVVWKKDEDGDWRMSQDMWNDGN